jgi:uncharacterized delta-60 repeat protein
MTNSSVRKIFFSVLLVSSHLFFSAQTIELDPSFDVDGIVITDFETEEDVCRALAIQDDGKIVAVGYNYDGLFALARYNPNGSLDNTFDSDGIVTTLVGTPGSRAHAVVIQNNGKIIAAGYGSNGSNIDFAVVRYNSDGSLDTSFDNDGIVLTNFGEFSNDRAFDIIIQDDEKIVACGYNTDQETGRDFAMIRYNTDGSLDNTFNGTGMVSTPIEIAVDEARSINIQNDGKIVLAGFSFDSFIRNFTVVRYNSDGTLDNTFDSDGIVTTSITSYDDAAYDSAIQNDGKIVLVGYTSGETYDFAIVRYNEDGSLDNTFGTDGIVITPIGNGADLGYSLLIQEDSKILVAGHADFNDNAFALIRYNSDGSLDNSFDSDGIVTTQIGPVWSDDVIFSMLLQADGNILVGGQTSDTDNNDYSFALARYINSGNISVDEKETHALDINIYPNPCTSQITLKVDNSMNDVDLFITNSLGLTIRSWNNVNTETFVLDCENLSNGLYFVQLFHSGKLISKGEFVIQN